MIEGSVIEGEIVAEKPLAIRADASAAVWTPTFAVAVDEMVSRVEAKHDFFRRVMRKDDHYGAIPGAGTKQVLLKPGAELLLASMGLFAELSDAEPPIRDYGDSGNEGNVAYRRRCRIYRQTGPGEHDRVLVAQAEGYCTSRETKYRYRDEKPVCPQCGASTLFRSKNAGEGWFCWRKKGGCGATYAVDAIKAGGKIPNPELADTENTILKMADKRALVAATLIATGCSDIFTQDVEDDVPPPEEPPLPEHPPAAPRHAPVIAQDEPQKIDVALRAQFNTFISQQGLKPEIVKAVIEEVQTHYGHEATGYVADLYVGDEETEARRRLKRKAKELAGA